MFFRTALPFFLPLCLLWGQAESPPPRASAREVLDHLTRTIAWYRDVNAAFRPDSASAFAPQQENMHGAALKTLQLGFEYARAEAALLNAARNPDSTENVGQDLANQNLERAAAKASSRVAAVEARIDALNTELARPAAHSRTLLLAQRKQWTAELNLAKEVQRSIQSLIAFRGGMTSAKNEAVGLAARIRQLERSVPEIAQGPANAQKPAPVAEPLKASASAHAPSGIYGLVMELFSMLHTRRQLAHAIEESDALVEGLDRLRGPLLDELKAGVRRSEELANGAGDANLEQLENGERRINELAARIRLLSGVSQPLGRQGIAAETTRGYLAEALDSLEGRYADVGGDLLVRISLLGVAILTVLVISVLWRRMTFRYIRDLRRRRQFLVLRRVAVTGMIALVLVLGFITEFGSLATYAGFLTAGVAVALQNVILSVVGYFFLIGRYGVRIGDRVTISGVTGNVVDIGLVRIYLMELSRSGAEFHATGRVVGFSNSVLFQPAALFKQMPGADYVWRSAKLTLTADSDFQLAESKLTAALAATYQEYREEIETQHAAFEQSVDIHVAPPRPECRLRFSGAGLEATVLYPAPMKQASAMEDRMLRALYDAVAGEPRLKLAVPPLLESAAAAE